MKAEVEAIIADHPSYGYRRIQTELEARTGAVINHKRLRRLLDEWDLALKREVPRPEPSGVRQILDQASGELNLVEGWEPGPLEMLSTDFTEIRYANGRRKAYMIAAVDPVSSWVPGGVRVGPGPRPAPPRLVRSPAHFTGEVGPGHATGSEPGSRSGPIAFASASTRS